MIANAMEVLKTTSKLLPVPTTSTSPTHVAPIPTVQPDPVVQQFVGETGARTLWVVFALMVIASGAFAAMSWTVPLTRRLYHVVTTIITIIAALSYFAMATGHGVIVKHITVRHTHGHDIPDTFTHVEPRSSGPVTSTGV